MFNKKKRFKRKSGLNKMIDLKCFKAVLVEEGNAYKNVHKEQFCFICAISLSFLILLYFSQPFSIYINFEYMYVYHPL